MKTISIETFTKPLKSFNSYTRKDLYTNPIPQSLTQRILNTPSDATRALPSEQQQKISLPSPPSTVNVISSKGSPLTRFIIQHKTAIKIIASIITISIGVGLFSLAFKSEPNPLPVEPGLDPISVFTSYTRDKTERLNMSRKVAENQKNYCQKHGYHYAAYETNLANKGPSDKSLPYWSKIAGMIELLAKKSSLVNWFIWLDDDAIILNQSIRFEDIIQTYGGDDPEIHVIVTEDIPSASTMMNTGVLIVRNSAESLEFFQNLWNKRHEPIDSWSKDITYANCPHQSCLHEQQAMHDLLKNHRHLYPYVKIVPQTVNSIGTNTFERFSHYDVNRDMNLFYNDPWHSECKRDDFICQCTGLATRGKYSKDDWFVQNFREQCIDNLLQRVRE